MSNLVPPLTGTDGAVRFNCKVHTQANNNDFLCSSKLSMPIGTRRKRPLRVEC